MIGRTVEHGETGPRASVRSIVYRCSSPECRPVIECAYANTAAGAAAGIERLGPWAAQQLAVQTHNTGYRIEAVEIPVSVEHGSHSRSRPAAPHERPSGFRIMAIDGTHDGSPSRGRQTGRQAESELRAPIAQGRSAYGQGDSATWVHGGRCAISGHMGSKRWGITGESRPDVGYAAAGSTMGMVMQANASPLTLRVQWWREYNTEENRMTQIEWRGQWVDPK
jgi:hypothetical protein